MAKQNETAAKLPEIPEELFAVGNAVVVAPNGDRITLAGELTPEQREALGESKLRWRRPRSSAIVSRKTGRRISTTSIPTLGRHR
jgi:hypothetical protein